MTFSNRYSRATLSLDMHHVCWAVCHGLYHAGLIQWPSEWEVNQIWTSLPASLQSAFDGRMYPLCVDICFRPLTIGILPENLTDYYSGKPDVNAHVFAHMIVCDLYGRIRLSSPAHQSRHGEHFILRNSVLNSAFDSFFPANSSYGMLADGLFVGVSPQLDGVLALPYPGSNLNPQQYAYNCLHRYLRAIVENVFADLDKLFTVHSQEMSYPWFCQAGVVLSMHLLYNGIRSITGFIGATRYQNE